ncbi:MAG TPA: adenosylhopane nucleosidase [Xanthobacteraceae bacterium]|nr:adenosylhopane nucleosidase [Xanthobacteraceae bacterium]
MAVLAVAGMAFEARIAARAGARVICRGNEETLAGAIARAIGKDCRGLISFGVAGGLAPHLRAGTCIVGSTIFGGATPFTTDHHWSRSLLQTIPGAVHGDIVGVPAPVAHPEEKRDLHESTGAMAVDMESHVVASVAAARGLPVAAIRVITDSAARGLPQSALAAMRANGTIDIAAMIRSIVKAPGELPMLFRTARDALVGSFALLRSRQLLDASFGLPGYHVAPLPALDSHAAEARATNLSLS